MYWYSYPFVGMAFFWWVFWAFLIIGFFVFAVPVPRGRMRRYEHPLATLHRRYAAGELTTEQYEAQKARLQRDLEELSAHNVAVHGERRHYDRRRHA
jgi:putative membrane protein